MNVNINKTKASKRHRNKKYSTCIHQHTNTQSGLDFALVHVGVEANNCEASVHACALANAYNS